MEGLIAGILEAPKCKIIGTAGSDEGLKLIKTEGAQHTLNHSSKDYQKQVLDLTNGRGVDVIVEMLANVNLGHDLRMLSPRGRVVVVGSRGSVEINPRDLMTREGAVFGMVIWGCKPDWVTEPCVQ